MAGKSNDNKHNDDHDNNDDDDNYDDDEESNGIAFCNSTTYTDTHTPRVTYGQTFCDLQTLLHTILNFLVNVTK